MHQLEQPSTPTNKLKLKSFKMEICKWNKYHINKLRPCWPCCHIWSFSMTCTTRNTCYSVGIFTTPTLEMQNPRTKHMPTEASYQHLLTRTQIIFPLYFPPNCLCKDKRDRWTRSKAPLPLVGGTAPFYTSAIPVRYHSVTAVVPFRYLGAQTIQAPCSTEAVMESLRLL